MEDSRVRTSHSLARALASTVLDRVCGRKWSASFARYDLATSSWRTSQLSLLGDSTESSVTLPKAGTMRSGSLSAPATWEPLTDESGSSSWPTPLVARAKGQWSGNNRDNWRPSLEGAVVNWPTPQARDEKGPRTNHTNGGRDLTSDVLCLTASSQGGAPLAETMMWPTPDASLANEQESAESWVARQAREMKKHQNGNGMGTPLAIAVKLWPTATAGDAAGSGSRVLPGSNAHPGTSLTDATQRTFGGRLNPDWVDALMGFPVGYSGGLLAVEKIRTLGSRRASFRRLLGIIGDD